jgi:hypothetical protein
VLSTNRATGKQGAQIPLYVTDSDRELIVVPPPAAVGQAFVTVFGTVKNIYKVLPGSKNYTEIQWLASAGKSVRNSDDFCRLTKLGCRAGLNY